ncbi:MAG: thiamine phosphate synthase [Desulfomonile sp.]
MKNPASWEVYLVTDRAFSQGRSTLDIVEAAAHGGISVVQLREKDLEARDFFDEGLKIRAVLRLAGVPLIINDRVDVALALEADGVHLGQADLPLREARKILGPDRIIGYSVEEPGHINETTARYADYFAISPVFLTSTKKDISAPWGLEGLRKARSMTDKPLVAIGGVTQSNARMVIKAGADCVAVVTAIVSAEDPEAATRSLLIEVRAGKAARALQG